MRNRPIIHICIVAFLLSMLSVSGQSSAFTYQGQLTENSSPANGVYDFQFVLLDAPTGGNALETNQAAPVVVNNGIFTVSLDFGSTAFDGHARWLEMGVRTNGSVSPYTLLSAVQPITAVPYAIHAVNSVPTGSIMAYMGTNAPPGWFLCDGAAVSRTQYWRLFAVIGVANGSGDGVSSFNLPDLRGTFLRGMDGTAGVDPDRAARIAAKPGGNTGNALGSLQLDDFKSHSHGNGSFNRLLQSSSGPTTTDGTDFTLNEPDIINSAPMLSAGGSETRPRNIYVNYIIKE